MNIRVGMVFFAVLFLASSSGFNFVRPRPIRGEGLAPNQVVITIDDAPDETGPDGDTQTMKMARYLYERQIRATFFLVGCHFAGQPTPDPRSWICLGTSASWGVEILQELVALEHTVGNHTEDHIPLTLLADEEIRYQVLGMQTLLDSFQEPGLRLFRGPGLAYDERVGSTLKSDPYLRRLSGPIDQETGGQGWIDGEWIGGDWDCYRKDISPQACGDLYLRTIFATTLERGHGSIVLMHARHETMDGRDGSRDFPIQLLQYLVEQLQASGYVFAPIEDIPELQIQSKRRSPVREDDPGRDN